MHDILICMKVNDWLCEKTIRTHVLNHPILPLGVRHEKTTQCEFLKNFE